MASYDLRGNAYHRFRWLGSEPIPPTCDLRTSGWMLEETGEPSNDCIVVAQVGEPCDAGCQGLLSFPTDVRRFTLVVGVTNAQERAELLKAGFGEAVAYAIDPSEFEARASRLAEMTRWLPRHRCLGPLELDLLAREAYGFGKPMNLNPREFALMWRLSDAPGSTVSKQELIQDVWRMGFLPETNSIAVHMSRLRRKLEFVGMDGVIATANAEGYCLRLTERREAEAPASLPHCGAPQRHTVFARH